MMSNDVHTRAPHSCVVCIIRYYAIHTRTLAQLALYRRIALSHRLYIITHTSALAYFQSFCGSHKILHLKNRVQYFIYMAIDFNCINQNKKCKVHLRVNTFWIGGIYLEIRLKLTTKNKHFGIRNHPVYT